MLKSKVILPVICLTAFSGYANAYYEENIRLFDESYNSLTPSLGVIAKEKTIQGLPRSDGSLNYSVITAKHSANPLPYVSTSNTAYAKTGEIGFESNLGLSAFNVLSSMNYGFTVSGTPDSIVAISMKSIARFETSDNIQTRVFDGVNYTNGINRGAGSRAGLSVTLGDIPFMYEGICGADRCFNTLTNTNYDLYPYDTSIKINGEQLINSSDSFYAYNGPSGAESTKVSSGAINRWYDEFLIEAVFKIKLDGQGFSDGTVNIFSTSDAGVDAFTVGNVFDGSQFVYAKGYSYIDPFFSIDPAYLALNPNARLDFTAGVGNANPLSSVPVPAALPLMASVLGIFGIARRRNKAKSA